MDEWIVYTYSAGRYIMVERKSGVYKFLDDFSIEEQINLSPMIDAWNQSAAYGINCMRGDCD